MSDVTVILVNYRTEDYLAACLGSLKNAAVRTGIDVILIDNSPGGGAAEILREHFPGAKLIENDRNLGYAKAVNQGIGASGTEFVFVINPDTVARENSLDLLLDFMKSHPDAGIAGPKLVNPDGTIQPSCRRFYTMKTILLRRTFLGRIFRNSVSVRQHLMLDWAHDSVLEVDWITGAAMMVRRAAVSEVGPMDERFFLYFEDVDWCYRMKTFGWKIYYDPSSEFVHHYRRESANARFGKAKRAHLESWLRFSEKWSLVIYLLKRNRELVSRTLLLAADIAALFLAFYLSYLARANLGFLLEKPTPEFEVYRRFMVLAVIVGVGSAAYVGLYGRRKIADWVDLLFEVSRAMVLTSIILMASTFLLYARIYSRVALLMFLPISIAVLTAERFLFRLAQKRLALTKVDVRRILIVGSGALAEKARGAVLKSEAEGLELAGFLDTGKWFSEGAPNCSEISERLREAARLQRAGEIVLADNSTSIQAMWPALSELRGRGLSLALATDLGEVLAEGDGIEKMGGLGFVSLKRKTTPGGVTKRAVELSLASLALALLAVPMLLKAMYLAVRRKTPVFVGQEMLGEHGETVRVTVFNCDEAPVTKRPGESKRPGELRREASGLCAAPLLLSVVAGRIALVGVKPRFDSGGKDAAPDLCGKPGIFGMWKLAQSPEEEKSKDNEYLASWSTVQDLRTIARCVLRRRSRP